MTLVLQPMNVSTTWVILAFILMNYATNTWTTDIHNFFLV